MKKTTCFFLLIWLFAYIAFAAEAIVAIKPNWHRGMTQDGAIVDIRPDGFEWGKLERRKFFVIKVPDKMLENREETRKPLVEKIEYDYQILDEHVFHRWSHENKNEPTQVVAKWFASNNKDEYYYGTGLEVNGTISADGGYSFLECSYDNRVKLNGISIDNAPLESLKDHQWGCGDKDGLGFSTVYIKDASGNPSVIGTLVEFGTPTEITNGRLKYVYEYWNHLSIAELKEVRRKDKDNIFTQIKISPEDIKVKDANNTTTGNLSIISIP